MTGFGHADGSLSQGGVRLEVRTVNHRFLNVQIRLPAGWEMLQPGIEGALRERLQRGHVAVTVSRVRNPEGADERSAAPVEVDLARARGYLRAMELMVKDLGLPDPPTLRDLLGFRDLIRLSEVQDGEVPVTMEEIRPLLEVALDQVLTMRMTEGGRLGEDLLARITRLEESLVQVEAAAPARLEKERDRLREAITRLLGEAHAGLVDEDRITREVAHLAERWDIEEELVRFRSHTRMFRDTVLSPGAEGAGKRLGFILQEILRETNTLGSKANDARIQAEVVGMKEEVERLREQVENVE
jgi:uncharacterized protein (TIGR00255 family)